MTWTESQIAAHAHMTQAIEDCIQAFCPWDNGGITIGFVVIVSGADILKNSEVYEDDDDEEGTVSMSRYFAKRGQHPLLTRGIVERYLDNFRNG